MYNKNIKKLAIFLVVFTMFFIDIKGVKADTYDCGNESYQCISCEYDYKGKYKYTYYVKSDGAGTLSIVGQGDSSNVNYNVKQDSSAFLKNEKGLYCPKVYGQLIGSAKGNSTLTITFEKIKSAGSSSYIVDKESVEMSNTFNYNNNKPFIDEKKSDNSVTRRCENIEIQFSNTKATETSDKKATVIASGNNISLNVPQPFANAQNPICSTIKVEDFKDACPNDLIVWCISTAYASNTTNYSCVLKKKTDEGNLCNPIKNDKEQDGYSDIYNIDDDTGLDLGEGTLTIDCSSFSALHTLYVVALIVAPIAVILLGSIDYVKAVIASDEEKMKKFKSKLPKRITALILLFLTPFIISAIIENIAGGKATTMHCIIKGYSDPIKIQSSSSSSSEDNVPAGLKSACSKQCSNKSQNVEIECSKNCVNNYMTKSYGNCESTNQESVKTKCYEDYAKKFKSNNK